MIDIYLRPSLACNPVAKKCRMERHFCRADLLFKGALVHGSAGNDELLALQQRERMCVACSYFFESSFQLFIDR